MSGLRICLYCESLGLEDSRLHCQPVATFMLVSGLCGAGLQTKWVVYIIIPNLKMMGQSLQISQGFFVCLFVFSFCFFSFSSRGPG